MERIIVDAETDAEATASGRSGQQLSRGLIYAFQFLALGVICAALLHDVFTLLDQRSQPLKDFASYYVPARALALYPSINPYDLDALTRLNASAHFISHAFFAFGYPPATLLLLRPLALLPFSAASHLWTVLSHLCAIGTAILLGDAFAFVVRQNWQTAGPKPDSMLDQVHTILEGTSIKIGRWAFPTVPIAICIAVLLFAYPTASTYFYGQINLLVLFFLVLGLHAQLYNRPILAGISVAVAGALKLSPLFMLAFFFARGAWKALLWSLGASALFAAIPLVLISPQIFSQYSVALGIFNAAVVPLPNNESLAGILIQAARLFYLSPLLAGQLAQIVGGALAILAVGALLALTFFRSELPWRRAPQRSDRLNLDWLAYALLLVAYLLATPLVWGHYYVIALPALLALGAYPLLQQRAPYEGWTSIDGLVMLGAAIGLAFATGQLPLDTDHDTILASPTLALLLRSERVVALLIVWTLSAILITPMLRRAWSSRTVMNRAKAMANVSTSTRAQ